MYSVLLLTAALCSVVDAAYSYSGSWKDLPQQCGGLKWYNATDATSCKAECTRRLSCDAYQWIKGPSCWIGVPDGECNLNYATVLEGGEKENEPCGSYCSTTGCDWTTKWQCPWQQMVMTEATNSAGNTGYNCCCEQRTSVLEACAPEYNGITGVNVGGWLLYEAWIFSSKYADDFHWEQQGPEVVNNHRQTWYTEQDFYDMAKQGLNAVRVPVGYWILDTPGIRRYPYDASTGQKLEPTLKNYVGPAENYITDALNWAMQYGLKVNFDLHGAPGSQSGAQTTGYANNNWKPDFWDIDMSVTVMGYMAQKWGKHPALGFLTVLNEPSSKIPLDTLTSYYAQAYASIRAYSEVAVVFPVYQRTVSEFNSFMNTAKSYHNYYWDVHQYFCFSQLTLEQSLTGAASGGSYPSTLNFPDASQVIVSEWSLCTDGNDMGSYSDNWQSPQKVTGFMRQFDFTQRQTWEKTAGSFYWSWKGQDPISWGSPWSLKQNIQRGYTEFTAWTARTGDSFTWVEEPFQCYNLTLFEPNQLTAVTATQCKNQCAGNPYCEVYQFYEVNFVKECWTGATTDCVASAKSFKTLASERKLYENSNFLDVYAPSWGTYPPDSCAQWWSASWGANSNCQSCNQVGILYCGGTCMIHCPWTQHLVDVALDTSEEKTQIKVAKLGNITSSKALTYAVSPKASEPGTIVNVLAAFGMVVTFYGAFKHYCSKTDSVYTTLHVEH